jgi:hypothetical protein
MVQAFTGFRSTTGKSFDTEFEAWGEELRDFLVKHGADNDAIARKIVQAVVDDQPETLATLADIVENMDRCAPPPPPVAAEPLPDDLPFCKKCQHRHGVKDRCRADAIADDLITLDPGTLQEMRVKATFEPVDVFPGVQTAPPPRPCRSPVACSRNEYGICSCY